MLVFPLFFLSFFFFLYPTYWFSVSFFKILSIHLLPLFFTFTNNLNTTFLSTKHTKIKNLFLTLRSIQYTSFQGDRVKLKIHNLHYIYFHLSTFTHFYFSFTSTHSFTPSGQKVDSCQQRIVGPCGPLPLGLASGSQYLPASWEVPVHLWGWFVCHSHSLATAPSHTQGDNGLFAGHTHVLPQPPPARGDSSPFAGHLYLMPQPPHAQENNGLFVGHTLLFPQPLLPTRQGSWGWFCVWLTLTHKKDNNKVPFTFKSPITILDVSG